MELTRTDTQKLSHALTTAQAKLDEAIQILDGALVHLTEAQRASLLRAPRDFPRAGRSLARVMLDHPNVAALTEFDSDSVVEDLENVALLDPIEEKSAHISQLIADSRLLWLAEAYSPSLSAYAVAKAVAKKDARLAEVIRPLATIFGSRRAAQKPTPPSL
jgi:hypothetical protein